MDYRDHLNTQLASAPAQTAVAVTKDDDADVRFRALYVGTGGTVRVNDTDGNTVDFVNVPDGSTLPVSVTRVFDTGTTADDIVGLN